MQIGIPSIWRVNPPARVAVQHHRCCQSGRDVVNGCWSVASHWRRTQRDRSPLSFVSATLPLPQSAVQPFAERGSMTLDRDMRPRTGDWLRERIIRSRGLDGRIGKFVHGCERTRNGSLDSVTVMTLRWRQGDADLLGATGSSVDLGANGNLHLHVGVGGRVGRMVLMSFGVCE